MPAIKALAGDTLANLVDEARLFEAADLNAIGITDALVPGVVLQLPARTTNLLRERVQRKPTVPPVVALFGQTWTDLALQELGDEQRLFELCDANQAGITDDVAAGQLLNVPQADVGQRRTISYLKARRPASNRASTIAGTEEGIEFWAIEFDFTVS